MDKPLAEKPALLQMANERLKNVARFVVDTVIPPRCLLCRNTVATTASLCPRCWHGLNRIDDPVCDALGTPFEFDHGEGSLSAAAIAEPPPWDKSRAAVVFEDTAKHLAHLLKYQDVHEAGIAMARMMLGAGRRLIADCDVIIPVPLHRMRLWQRRFNQSAFLAHWIANASEKRCLTDVLLRTTRTRQQVGLSAEERRKNVRRAFTVDPDLQTHVSGKKVLLIDDVRTTGATLGACAQTLKKAGAAQVDALTFALVLEPLRPHIEA
jgi:ComF family protein